MAQEMTTLNGQAVPKDVVELATDDSGVNTAVVKFLAPDYKRRGEQDTEIRAPLAHLGDGVPTVIED